MNRRAAAALVMTVLFAAASSQAEETKPIEPGPWKFGTTIGLNLSQSAFSSNWAGGDKGSFVWVLNSDITAERQFTHKFNLSNLTRLAYGQTAKQVTDANNANRNVWDSPSKSTDLIQSETIGRFTLGSFADPFASVRLDSQFEDQSDPAGTIRFNPVKLTESAGLARVLEKTEKSEIITRLGLGFRQTFRKEFVDGGPETSSFSTNDGGVEWQTTASKPILNERVLYKGQLLVFVPVFFSQSGALKEFDDIAIAFEDTREPVAGFWKSPDVNFQNTFTAQITKIVSVNLYLQMVYDKFDAASNIDTSKDTADLIQSVDRGIRKASQFKENISIGLTYTLF